MKTSQKNIFIVIPSLNSSGPSKGAIALSNLLSQSFKVSLITLKENESCDTDFLEEGVEKIEYKNYFFSLFKFFNIVLSKKPIAVISFCIFPDCLNLISYGNHKKILSFRTNHKSGYKDIYGSFGILISYLHNLFPILSDTTVVMSLEHLKKLPKVSREKSVVIKNFIDKYFTPPKVKFNQSSKYNLIVVSNLTKRKRIDLSMKFANQHPSFFDSISIFGKGPEEDYLKEYSNNLKIKSNFHGFVKNPWEIIPRNPCFIHLSEDEGFPRAMLEAMKINIPIITFNFTGCEEYFNSNDQVLIIKEKNNIFNLDASLGTLLSENSFVSNYSFFEENNYEGLLESYKGLILDKL